jgi:acetyl-CoA carboxylase carboxyltransferase component/biotin carboxyl carrier protein
MEREFHGAALDGLAEISEDIRPHYADVAILHLAILTYDADFELEQKRFYASAVRGRPRVKTEVGVPVAIRFRGHSYSLTTYCVSPRQYRVEIDGECIDVRLERLDHVQHRLTAFGRCFNVISVVEDSNVRVEVEGVSHLVERDDNGLVYASAPAVVASVAVKPGDKVAAGDRLAVLEAMKLEMPLVAPFSGTVLKVLILPNVQVTTGTPLIEIERRPSQGTYSTGERIHFGASRSSERPLGVPCGVGEHTLEGLRRFVLGFDVDAGEVRRLFVEWERSRAESTADQVREAELLRAFVDISLLFHRHPKLDRRTGGEIPSAEELLFSYLRSIDTAGEGLPAGFMEAVRRALAHYGVRSLDRTPELEESLLYLYKSHQRLEQQLPIVVAVLQRRLWAGEGAPDESFRALLDRLVVITNGLYPSVSDLAREVRYRCFEQPAFEQARNKIYAEAEENLAYLEKNATAAQGQDRVRALLECPQLLFSLFNRRFATVHPTLSQLMLEVLTSRYYNCHGLTNLASVWRNGYPIVAAKYTHESKHVYLFTIQTEYPKLVDAAHSLHSLIETVPVESEVVVDFYLSFASAMGDSEAMQQEIQAVLNAAEFPRVIRRVVIAVSDFTNGHSSSAVRHFTFRFLDDTYQEDKIFRGVHPAIARRLQLWRLANFDITRLPSVEDVYLLHAVGRENPKDERLFAIAEVRDLTPVRDADGRIVRLPHLERMFAECLAGIRLFQASRLPNERLYWNRIFLYVWPPMRLDTDEFQSILNRLVPGTEGLGLEQVVVRVRSPHPQTGELRDIMVRISRPGGAAPLVTFRPAGKLQPLMPLTEYDQKVIRMRRRGLVYPYEIIRMLTPPAENARAAFPHGQFVEYDLDEQGRLVEVNRPHGENRANIIVGLIRNFTTKYPEGMERVMLLGDPSKDLGALAEPECRRIMAAIDLASARRIPLEWFAISAGAKISMDSGVENMEWIASVLRRLVEFTQANGEVNLIINGINVGAQPYWNAEATMLMHTRGILVMTPAAAMVLTGKKALDFSGSVSAEDSQGIGGYDRIMGLNGQAQYWANDIHEACNILFGHYEHTYIMPGERFPRCAVTTDPVERDVCSYPHKSNGDGFSRIGEILYDETNPGRKKGFEIREVMRSVIDQDHPHLERWAGMKDAETAVVWDAHLGTYPVCLIGFESHRVSRLGFVPADGPEQWTAGTLFPMSSKKVARAINAATNNRPVVVLANLSGFDGSPESMRKLQLEYGAEIGRAVVNFRGPIVFCVISRYHGGAYVVFSRMLNDNLEVAALEGTFASVIGGAPAAAVVFASEVEARTRKDPRLQPLTEQMSQAKGADKARLRGQWDELFKVIHSEKLGEVAAQFDHIHSVHRALAVGALNYIIPPAELRPYLIHAVERGIARELRSHVREGEPEILAERIRRVVAPELINEAILVRTAAVGPAGEP